MSDYEYEYGYKYEYGYEYKYAYEIYSTIKMFNLLNDEEPHPSSGLLSTRNPVARMRTRPADV